MYRGMKNANRFKMLFLCKGDIRTKTESTSTYADYMHISEWWCQNNQDIDVMKFVLVLIAKVIIVCFAKPNDS